MNRATLLVVAAISTLVGCTQQTSDGSTSSSAPSALFAQNQVRDDLLNKSPFVQVNVAEGSTWERITLSVGESTDDFVTELCKGDFANPTSCEIDRRGRFAVKLMGLKNGVHFYDPDTYDEDYDLDWPQQDVPMLLPVADNLILVPLANVDTYKNRYR